MKGANCARRRFAKPGLTKTWSTVTTSPVSGEGTRVGSQYYHSSHHFVGRYREMESSWLTFETEFEIESSSRTTLLYCRSVPEEKIQPQVTHWVIPRHGLGSSTNSY